MQQLTTTSAVLHPIRPLVLALIAAFALLAGPAWALDPQQPIHRYALAKWDRSTGLPSTSIQALLQTRDGFLWLGTQDGLVRYDGTRFDVFHSREHREIGNNHIKALLEARDGALWFTTMGGGVVRMKEGELQAFTSAHGLSSDVARVLIEDRDGAVWVGTEAGLNRIHDGVVTSWNLGEELGDQVIQDLHVDPAGRLWVASRSGGTCIFADGACRAPELPPGLELHHVRALLSGADGSMWVGTEGFGLVHIQGEGFTRYTTQEGLSCVEVTSLLEDRDGNVWIGTRRDGISRIGPGGPEHFDTDGGLSHPHVTSLLEDREGNVWVATYAGGLNSLREATFVTYGARDGISTDVVLSVVEDHLGYIWVGTMQGLFRVHGERAVDYAGMERMDQVAVLAMYEDGQETLWVGTYGQGLFRFQDGAWKSWTVEEGLPANYVFAMAEDSAGGLWLGTQQGLVRMVGGGFQEPDIQPELADLTVRMLHTDASGQLWVGFDSAGLYRWTGERLEAVPLPEDHPPNVLKVTTAHESADGTLWFGTEGGLLRLRDGELKLIGSEAGLLDERIWRVLEDEQGNLWLSSNRGVYRLEPDEIEAYFGGRRLRVSYQAFDTADGMASAECNGGFLNAGYRTSDGRLWFPTTKGLAVVKPAEALRPKPIPPVTIERVLVDDEPVDHHRPVVLQPDDFRLVIQYTAPFLVAPEKVRFRYRLDDQDWSGDKVLREATYTNLDPGTYRFQVIASNGYGAWNERGANVVFTVLPAFYQTAWFYAACAVGLLLLVLALYWRRERQHRLRQQELREEILRATEELAALAEERKELSLRDTLTNLRNRRFLQESVRPMVAAISRQHANVGSVIHNVRRPTIADRIGLAIVDIDHFKAVNDNHGHDAGDAVLEQFSQLLLDTARGQDVVARWGGEEFLVVLLGVDEEGLRAFGERFRRRVAAREFTLPGGGSLRKTCSVGLCGCPFYEAGELGLGLEQLVSVADLGLYHAKRTGRDRCVLVKPGAHSPANREEAIKGFQSIESATGGGYVELEVVEG
jgi:diguanylate cyclase (GGDEF)-like protein